MKILASIIFLSFVTLAVFGLPLMGHIDHEMGCPFAPGGSAVCGEPLAHVQHWQSALVAVVSQIVILLTIAFAVIGWLYSLIGTEVQYERYRLRTRIPIRPPLLQELFSNGILHRKEPHIA